MNLPRNESPQARSDKWTDFCPLCGQRFVAPTKLQVAAKYRKHEESHEKRVDNSQPPTMREAQ